MYAVMLALSGVRRASICWRISGARYRCRATTPPASSSAWHRAWQRSVARGIVSSKSISTDGSAAAASAKLA